MPLMITVGGASEIADGVWSAFLSPAEVRRLGTATSLGDRSIVGLFQPHFEAASGQLMLDPRSTIVLTVGTSEEALLIDLKRKVSDQTMLAKGPLQPIGKGDEAFIRVGRELLSDDLMSLIERLLEQVRQLYPGELREHQARKWVNSPDNFLAITIQPRDRSFAIYARGEPGGGATPSSIDVKPDRPGYVRFKLQNPSQLEDALRIILGSARRRNRS